MESASRLMLQETTPLLNSLMDAAADFVKAQGQLADQAAQQAAAVHERGRNALLLFLVVAAVVSVVSARWIIRTVTGPLGGEPDEVTALAQRIASGDLTMEVLVKPGDKNSLVAVMASMQDSLRRMAAELQANAESVAAAAEQLATASNQVSASTEAQSEAAAMMASAIEQMSASVSHVSLNANDAHAVTTEVGSLSADGSQVIQGTVVEMQDIATTVNGAAKTIFEMGEHAERITGVVQVITEIADQTNLLALNAAIEAARAGEAGRGFAVVADEVRKLAERTTVATGEIGAMIGNIHEISRNAVSAMEVAGQKVDSGVNLAQRADEAMARITESAARVEQAVSDMASALQEQNSTTTQMVASVEKIAQMSEENRAAAGEAASTALSLEGLAEAGRNSANRFRLA
jgi:methyl-accepting chemotaxis protein